MSGLDLVNATIGRLSKLLAGGELSPVELAAATLERIERLNPSA